MNDNRIKLENALLNAHTEIESLCDEIKNLVQSRINPEKANWGTVGDMNYVKECLALAQQHLLGNPLES